MFTPAVPKQQRNLPRTRRCLLSAVDVCYRALTSTALGREQPFVHCKRSSGALPMMVKIVDGKVVSIERAE